MRRTISASLVTGRSLASLALAVNSLPLFKMRDVARIGLILLALIDSLATPIAAQTARSLRFGAPLSARLARVIDEPPFDRALWGIAIADPSGHIVFDRNADRLFVPASNNKLLVTAAAVLLLPEDFRFRTSVYGAGAITDSVLRGDLVLYGRGDPTISDRYYADRLDVFHELADSLRAHGITRVEGDVVGDASYFDSVTIHPAWEAYDLTWWYAAPVTAIAFNDNAVDFRITPSAPGLAPVVTFEPDLGLVQFTNRARTVPVDAPRTIDFHRALGTGTVWADGDVPTDARPWVENVSVPDGALWAATAFRRALEDRGISIAGHVRATYDSSAYAAARLTDPLAEHLSRPLPDILDPILKVSHNWYAEMLLKTLGRLRTGVGSWDSGLAVERRVLADSLRVDTSLVEPTDASGLAHTNLVAPHAFVDLLHAMHRHRRGQLFVNALPVSGGTGTLRFRYRGNGLRGRVRAKTGTIANTNTLSGYLEGRGGTWTFSIQINHHVALNREALRRIDAIVAELER